MRRYTKTFGDEKNKRSFSVEETHPELRILDGGHCYLHAVRVPVGWLSSPGGIKIVRCPEVIAYPELVALKDWAEMA